jgi:ribosomal protein S18 acetylase RimI-like enzyme
VAEILDMVDTSLSSTSLSPEQLAECKLFLFIAGRRVVGCAVATRISEAYRVVRRTPPPPPSSDSSSPPPPSSSDLLRFDGDSHASALFCSPKPSPAHLGVHRIFVSPSYRRCGVATMLLNAIAQRFIYGCPIPKMDVAFSQPTGDGQRLARKWTGAKDGVGWAVFV